MIANSCDLFNKSFTHTTVEWKSRTAIGDRWEFITLLRTVHFKWFLIEWGSKSTENGAFDRSICVRW